MIVVTNNKGRPGVATTARRLAEGRPDLAAIEAGRDRHAVADLRQAEPGGDRRRSATMSCAGRPGLVAP